LQWWKAARAAALTEGKGIAVEVEGEEIALYKVAGEVFAVSNICSHAYAQLSEGTIEGYVITCPRHGGQFDVRTGKAVRVPAVSPIATYPVRLEGDDVYVAVET
jgi:nitrite reductase/ring-hydroxylating ferredoxin subunit